MLGSLKIPIIGVFGGASTDYGIETMDRCKEVGALLAELGVHLLTGGGPGIMEWVNQSFVEHPARKPIGHTIGIIPAKSIDEPTIPKKPYPNGYIEIPIFTHLASTKGDDIYSRNNINVLTPNAIIVLDGKSGTEGEVRLIEKFQRIDRAISYAISADRHVSLPWAKDREQLENFILSVIKHS